MKILRSTLPAAAVHLGLLLGASSLSAQEPAPTPAPAREVYVNGVPIHRAAPAIHLTEVQEVLVDAEGTVHILAPAHPVVDATGALQVPEPGAWRVVMGGTWWLITEPSGAAGLSDRVEVWINDRMVHVAESQAAQVMVEVTSHLRPGENRVVFRASRARPSVAGMTPFRVTVGRGVTGEGALRLDTAVAITRTAESQSTETHTFEGMIDRTRGFVRQGPPHREP